MFKFIIIRFLSIIPVLWITVTLAFVLIRLAPGGPFSDEKVIPPQALEQLNKHYGFDKPIFVQYGRYMKNLVHGKLGPSLKYQNRTVNEIIAETFPVSLELGCWALAFALMIGLTAGIIASLKPNTALDYIPMSIAMVGICIPSFVLGPLLVLSFSLGLGWFNASGWNSMSDRVLPAITLGSAYAAYIARLSRAGMLDILPQDFIRTARAKGLREARVISCHALKPGIFPVVSFLGPAVAGLITGSFVIETIFNIPGLGRQFVTAALNRDYFLVLGLVAFYSTLVVSFNTIVDIILVVLNPQLREKA